MSRGPVIALPFAERDDPTPDLSSISRGLCGLCAPLPVHDLTTRTARQPESRRGRSGPSARLPHDRALRQSDAQTASLGRTALCRSQSVARLASVPLARVGEGQRRGAAGRRRAEPEAPAQPVGLGTTTLPERRRRSRPPAAIASGNPDAIIAVLHSDHIAGTLGIASLLPFFNTLDRF